MDKSKVTIRLLEAPSDHVKASALKSAERARHSPVFSEINKAIVARKADVVVIALSGGIDSMVTLDAASRLRNECQPSSPNKELSASICQPFKLHAIHVNHGISANSDVWEEFCKAQCEARDVPLHIAKANLSKHTQHSLEAQARDARYQLIHDHVNAIYCDKDPALNVAILLGQHQRDQAETFLLQLKRGAGVKGLASMPCVSAGNVSQQNHAKEEGTIAYCRPFLSIPKDDIDAYAQQHNLVWIEDESNQDIQYDRNFIRKAVLPSLRKRWPHIDKAISRSAEHCGETQDVVDEYMALLSEEIVFNGKLKVSALLALSMAAQKSFIRYCLGQHKQLMPSVAQLEDIISIINNDEKSASVVHLSGVSVEKSQGWLHINPMGSALLTPFVINWQHQSSFIILPKLVLKRVDEYTNKSPCFHLPRYNVEVRYGMSNAKATFEDKRPSKSLKKWYQEWGITAQQRRQVAVLVANAEVIALVLPKHLSYPKISVNGVILNQSFDRTKHKETLLVALDVI